MKGILILLSIIMAVWGKYLPHSVMEKNQRGYAQVDDEVEIASEAFIYLYSMVVTMNTVFHAALWPHSNNYVSINRLASSYIVDWSNSSTTDPCLDILYSKIFLDLENPLVFNVPDIPQKRYYGFMIKDIYDINIKVISSRTRGGSWEADQYVIVGPGFSGSLPSRFDDDHIIRSLSRFSVIVARTQIFDIDDASNVAAIQNGYTITSLDGNKPQKTNIPIFPYMEKGAAQNPDMEAQVFFSYANFMLNYVEIKDSESDIYKRLAKIDLGPSKEFIGQRMSQQRYKDIQDGVTNGSMTLQGPTPDSIPVGGWRRLYPSKIVHTDYLGRAFRAKSGGIYISEPEEVSYYHGLIDIDGDPLDSTKYDYTLTFLRGQFPPVVEEYGGFWSFTAYLGSGALIHNPIDRYNINIRTTTGLVYDANGALTLYIQKTRPDTDEKSANWLPTPDPEFGGYETGRFEVILRLYVPEDLSYSPPVMVKAGPATL